MAAPIPMSRPVDECSLGSDWSPDAAAEEATPVAGSVVGAGVIVKGLTGGFSSVKGPTVPASLVKKESSASPSTKGSSVVGIVAPLSLIHWQVEKWLTASGWG